MLLAPFASSLKRGSALKKLASCILVAVLCVMFAPTFNFKQVKVGASNFIPNDGSTSSLPGFSDEFNSSTLDPRWTVIDPGGGV